MPKYPFTYPTFHLPTYFIKLALKKVLTSRRIFPFCTKLQSFSLELEILEGDDSESQETLKNSKIDKCKMLTLNAYPSSKMKWVTVLLIPFGTSSPSVPSLFEFYVGHS